MDNKDIRKVNYRDDLDFVMRLLDCDGNETGWPAYDWTARFWTDGYGLSRGRLNAVTASCRGGECVNCYDDSGRIHVVLDSHGLPPGRLNVEFTAELPDGVYPDGTKRVVVPAPLGIELVREAGGCPCGVEVEFVVPYAVVDAWMTAREAGFGGSREEYYAGLSMLPALSALTSDMARGKAEVAGALTRRGYPTDPAAALGEMAQTITGMDYSYRGWLSAIGYPDGYAEQYMSDRVAYSARLAAEYVAGESCANLFKDDTRLVYAPALDTAGVTDASYMFYGCTCLETVPGYDLWSVANANCMFYNCTRLQKLPERIVMPACANANAMFYQAAVSASSPVGRVSLTIGGVNLGWTQSIFESANISDIHLTILSTIGETWTGYRYFFRKCKATRITFDISARTDTLQMSSCFTECVNAQYVLIKGYRGNTSDISALTNWGRGSEENRRSIVDTLLTYSHDLAAAGLAAATVKLATAVRERLTDDEIAAITAKGYTIA